MIQIYAMNFLSTMALQCLVSLWTAYGLFPSAYIRFRSRTLVEHCDDEVLPIEPNEAGLSRQSQAGANQYISRLNPGREKRTSFTLRLKHFRPCPRITLAILLLVILLQSLLCPVHWLYCVRHYDWLHHVWFYYVRF